MYFNVVTINCSLEVLHGMLQPGYSILRIIRLQTIKIFVVIVTQYFDWGEPTYRELEGCRNTFVLKEMCAFIVTS